MYVPDESADAIVAKDVKLQAVVRGAAIMLGLPGQGANVSVNGCLVFGWMGTMLAVYWMVPQLRYEMHWYALLIVAVMSVMGVIWYTLLRGHAAAGTAFALVAQRLVAAPRTRSSRPSSEPNERTRKRRQPAASRRREVYLEAAFGAVPGTF